MFDACIPQHDGFRFMYVLPLSRERVLVEETFFSDQPQLDEAQGERAVLAYANAQGLHVREVQRRERGVLPMPWSDGTNVAPFDMTHDNLCRWIMSRTPCGGPPGSSGTNAPPAFKTARNDVMVDKERSRRTPANAPFVIPAAVSRSQSASVLASRSA